MTVNLSSITITGRVIIGLQPPLYLEFGSNDVNKLAPYSFTSVDNFIFIGLSTTVNAPYSISSSPELLPFNSSSTTVNAPYSISSSPELLAIVGLSTTEIAPYSFSS